MGGVRIGCHHRIADRLHDRAAMADGRLAQQVKMLLDKLEGIQVADPLVECGRAPDVGEQQRDVADREPFAPPTTSERNRLLKVWVVSRCLPVR